MEDPRDPLIKSSMNDAVHADHVKSPRGFSCRDPFFAALFVVQTVLLAWLAFGYGINALSESNDDGSVTNAGLTSNGDTKNIIFALCLTVLIAAGLSSAWLNWALNDAEGMIRTSFYVNAGLYIAVAVLALAFGQIIVGVIFALFTLFMYCYWRSVQSQIPFAAATLSVGASALQAHPATHVVVLATMIASVAWSLLWALGVIGLNKLDASLVHNGGMVFVLLVSFYWGIHHPSLNLLSYKCLLKAYPVRWHGVQKRGSCDGLRSSCKLVVHATRLRAVCRLWRPHASVDVFVWIDLFWLSYRGDPRGCSSHLAELGKTIIARLP